MLVVEMTRDHPAGRAEHSRGDGESLSARLGGENLNHFLVEELHLRDSESEGVFREAHGPFDYTTVHSWGSFGSRLAAKSWG